MPAGLSHPISYCHSRGKPRESCWSGVAAPAAGERGARGFGQAWGGQDRAGGAVPSVWGWGWPGAQAEVWEGKWWAGGWGRRGLGGGAVV